MDKAGGHFKRDPWSSVGEAGGPGGLVKAGHQAELHAYQHRSMLRSTTGFNTYSTSSCSGSSVEPKILALRELILP